MKLYTAGASPFARKVGVVLHETGLFDAVEMAVITTAPGATNASLQTANPIGKLPALSRDDGPALYDSRVICRYLNTRTNAGLYPDGDWDALVLEATGDGMMDSAVSMIYERRFRSEEIVSEDWIAAQWAKVTGAMTALEAMWMAHLKGPVTIGPIAVACALGYLDFRHAERNWQAHYPELAAWYKEFCKRESMQLTIPA